MRSKCLDERERESARTASGASSNPPPGDCSCDPQSCWLRRPPFPFPGPGARALGAPARCPRAARARPLWLVLHLRRRAARWTSLARLPRPHQRGASEHSVARPPLSSPAGLAIERKSSHERHRHRGARSGGSSASGGYLRAFVVLIRLLCSPSQYDLSVSTFSPDGRVFQTEYAQKAVDNGGCAFSEAHPRRDLVPALPVASRSTLPSAFSIPARRAPDRPCALFPSLSRSTVIGVQCKGGVVLVRCSPDPPAREVASGLFSSMRALRSRQGMRGGERATNAERRRPRDEAGRGKWRAEPRGGARAW